MKGYVVPAVLLIAAMCLQLFASRSAPTVSQDDAPAASQLEVTPILKEAAPTPKAYFDGREAPAEAVVMRDQVAAIKRAEAPQAMFAGEQPVQRPSFRTPARRALSKAGRFLRHPFRPRLRGCG